MGTTLNANLREITPAMAAEFMLANTNNRCVNVRLVKRYAADIKAGVWKINGESIIFSEDGTLLDGQHRLLAVIEADAPITSLVVGGVPRSAGDTINIGKSKRVSDHLAIMGYQNASRRQSVTRLLYAWEEGRPLGNAPSRSPSVNETVEVMERWEPHLTEAIRLAVICAGNRHGVYPSALIVFFTLACAVDEANGNVMEFAEQFAYGAGLEVGHPVLHLRNHLTSQLARNVSWERNQHLAWLTQAWTALQENRDRRRYMKTSPLTQFPGLIGRTGKTK